MRSCNRVCVASINGDGVQKQLAEVRGPRRGHHGRGASWSMLGLGCNRRGGTRRAAGGCGPKAGGKMCWCRLAATGVCCPMASAARFDAAAPRLVLHLSWIPVVRQKGRGTAPPSCYNGMKLGVIFTPQFVTKVRFWGGKIYSPFCYVSCRLGGKRAFRVNVSHKLYTPIAYVCNILGVF